MKLTDIIIGERVRKDMGDLVGLAESIQRSGLLHPIVVKPDGTLIAGRRRLEAVRLLAWKDVPATVIAVDDIFIAERDENAERKNFTPTEAVAIGVLIEQRHAFKVAAQVHEIAVAAGQKRQGIKPVIRYTRAGPSINAAARAIGISPATYVRARRVCIAAQADPQRLGDLPGAMDTTGNIAGAYRELKLRINDPAREPKPVSAKRGPSKRPKRAPRNPIFKGMRYPDPNRAVERAVPMLDGALDVLEQSKLEDLDAARTEQWAIDLKKFARRLSRIAERIRGA